MNPISPKVTNGGTAGGLTVLLTSLLIKALNHYTPIDADTAVQIAGIITVLMTIFVAWLTPHDAYIANLIAAANDAPPPPQPALPPPPPLPAPPPPAPVGA